MEFVSLDLQSAEDRYRLEQVDALTPDKIFDARWAMALLGEAMTRLRKEYGAQGKTPTFETLRVFLDIGNRKDPPCYEQAADRLQISVGAVKTLIHRMRKMYAAFVREEITRTVSDSAEVDAEVHELCEALIAAEGVILA
jgi:RNA polymerase sigma-70 factor (ECF subfamily)